MKNSNIHHVVINYGNISYRYTSELTKEFYMSEEVIASFDTEKEALQFIEKEKERIKDEWILKNYGSMEEYMETRRYS